MCHELFPRTSKADLHKHVNPGEVEKEAGPAAVRRVPPGLLDALPVHALGVLGIVVVVEQNVILCATNCSQAPRKQIYINMQRRSAPTCHAPRSTRQNGIPRAAL